MSLYILTLDEAKTELEILDAQNDLQLAMHMEQLQGRLEDYLQRRLCRVENVQETIFGGGRALLLATFPVESVQSVLFDSLTIAADMYTLIPMRGRLFYKTFSSCDRWPEGAIVVTYTAGYVAAGTSTGIGQFAMPEGIRGAFRMQLSYEWRNRRIMGQNSVSAQGHSVQLAPAKFLPVVIDALHSFRRI